VTSSGLIEPVLKADSNALLVTLLNYKPFRSPGVVSGNNATSVRPGHRQITSRRQRGPSRSFRHELTALSDSDLKHRAQVARR